jgi:hypothetical protein
MMSEFRRFVAIVSGKPIDPGRGRLFGALSPGRARRYDTEYMSEGAGQ